jgi:hypothetical protein
MHRMDNGEPDLVTSDHVTQALVAPSIYLGDYE